MVCGCAVVKVKLQKLANELGIAIKVTHLPSGTSKWNRIKHRLFAFIRQNWRGKPLVSHEVIVQLIGNTTTKAGLNVLCRIDDTLYPKGITVSDAELEAVNLTQDDFHGESGTTPSHHHTIHGRADLKNEAVILSRPLDDK